MNYIKVRGVKPRIYGNPYTYEAKIIGRVGPKLWSDNMGTTRGHLTGSAAYAAALKLAGRRGLKIEDDSRGAKLRALEYRDTYGDDL